MAGGVTLRFGAVPVCVQQVLGSQVKVQGHDASSIVENALFGIVDATS